MNIEKLINATEEYDASNDECTLLKNSEMCYKITSDDRKNFDEYLFVMKYEDEEEE